MNGYTGAVVAPGGMYVRALYDYDADDRTSLSFRQGDIIQVITQLESGWWDGVINGVRGWFPSNYCDVFPRSVDVGLDERIAEEAEDADVEEGPQDGPDGQDDDADSAVDEEGDSFASQLSMNGRGNSEQEEAAFWIPQATPDGRLFYFNTLTGASTMELPLESPSSSTENGPRDRTNVYIPEQTRPPLELMAGGYVNDDTDYETSASEAEGRSLLTDSHGSLVGYLLAALLRRSNIIYSINTIHFFLTAFGPQHLWILSVLLLLPDLALKAATQPPAVSPWSTAPCQLLGLQ